MTRNGRIAAGLHYLRHDSPIRDFAIHLRDVLCRADLRTLALLLRQRDPEPVRDELARLFDEHWLAALSAAMPPDTAEERTHT